MKSPFTPVIPEPLRAPNHHAGPLQPRLDATSGGLTEVAGFNQRHARLAAKLDQSFGCRMVAVIFPPTPPRVAIRPG